MAVGGRSAAGPRRPDADAEPSSIDAPTRWTCQRAGPGHTRTSFATPATLDGGPERAKPGAWLASPPSSLPSASR
jgi:hypothetical protein